MERRRDPGLVTPMQNSDHDSPRVFLEALRPGQVCRGIVTSVADFGVFVDLGGGVGFITVPNLSWRRIDHPSQVVHVGQEVVGAVLSVDLDREQASFSLKDLQQDPLLDFALTRFGSTVTGSVTKVAPVGAFVQVGEGVEGFLPAAELAGHGNAPEAGDALTVTVTYINVERRQVILSYAGAGR